MASSKIKTPNMEEDEILLFGDDHLELGDTSTLDEEAILGGDDFPSPTTDIKAAAEEGREREIESAGGTLVEVGSLRNLSQEELNYDEDDESPPKAAEALQPSSGEVEAGVGDREENEEEGGEERERSRDSRFTSERTAPPAQLPSQSQGPRQQRRFDYNRPNSNNNNRQVGVHKPYAGTSAPRSGAGGSGAKCYINPNFKGAIPGGFSHRRKFSLINQPTPIPANIISSLQQGSYVSPQALQAQQYGSISSSSSYPAPYGQPQPTVYIRPATAYTYPTYNHTAPPTHASGVGAGFAPPVPGSAYQYSANAAAAHNPQMGSQSNWSAASWSSMVDAFVKRTSRAGEWRGFLKIN